MNSDFYYTNLIFIEIFFSYNYVPVRTYKILMFTDDCSIIHSDLHDDSTTNINGGCVLESLAS